MTNFRPTPPCGTTAAHARHRRYGETVDADCQAAASAMKLASKRRAAARRRCEIAARDAALEAVSHGHPAGFDELYQSALLEELAAAFGGAR